MVICESDVRLRAEDLIFRFFVHKEVMSIHIPNMAQNYAYCEETEKGRRCRRELCRYTLDQMALHDGVSQVLGCVRSDARCEKKSKEDESGAGTVSG